MLNSKYLAPPQHLCQTSAWRSLSNKFQTLRFFFRPRKFVAQYKLFFDDGWLEASVDSIAPYVYKILFVISDVAWGDSKEKPHIKGDDFSEVIQRLKTKYPDKIVVHKGSWNAQLMHVQAGLDYIKRNIPEATHCLYIDSDEIYREEQIKNVLQLAYSYKTFNSAIRINYNTYFKTIYYKIHPCKYPLALALFPLCDWVEYRNERNVNAKIVEFPELYYEHPGYVRFGEERMRLKMEAHKETEPILYNWYNEVWLKWTPETKNFHPTNPEFWEGVVPVNPQDLPEAMVRVYEENVRRN